MRWLRTARYVAWIASTVVCVVLVLAVLAGFIWALVDEPRMAVVLGVIVTVFAALWYADNGRPAGR